MKRYLSLFLTLVVFIAFNLTAAARTLTTETITVDDKIDYLISHGMPEDFLENKDAEAIEYIYNSLYGEEFQFLGTETVKMSETSSSSEVSRLGVISESDMVLGISTSITLTSQGSKKVIKEVMVFVDYEWFNGKPMICKEDGISVNWDSGLFGFKPNSFRSNDYKKFIYEEYGFTKVSDWINSDYQTNPMMINQGGLGYVVYLNRGNPPPNTKDLYGAKGNARFTLQPLGTIYDGNSRNTFINAEYTHDKDPLPWLKIGFSVAGVGVTVDCGSSSLRDQVAKAIGVKYST